MENRIANLVIVGAGALLGLAAVAAASGALAPVWSFFHDGLIEHFLSMQWARFSCF